MRTRQSIRLQNYDYTQPGAYFVTVCATQRECLFGEVLNGVMRPNAIGDLVIQTWHSLPQRFANVKLDEFVVMPNHVHGVVCIGEMANKSCRDACEDAASNAPTAAQSDPVQKSLADVVRAFKSISAIAGNRLLQRQGQPLWQRNYYERIIRNDEELNRVREYIINNPAHWDYDDENPRRMNGEQRGM